MHVYTPPGYKGGTGRYPVLYLLHGGGDDDASWTSIGRAAFILDNLIAVGKTVPFITVMPDMNKPRDEGVRPAMGTVAERREFEDELFRDVRIEKTYRVSAGTSNRAVAGLSVGGYATLNLLSHHTDQFSYFGIWSAPVENRTVAEAETAFAPILDHPEKVNDAGKVVGSVSGRKCWCCQRQGDLRYFRQALLTPRASLERRFS